MPAPKGDPCYIKNKDRYFMSIATAIARGSTHPIVPGGCVLIRDREVIGDGGLFCVNQKLKLIVLPTPLPLALNEVRQLLELLFTARAIHSLHLSSKPI